LRWQVRWLPTSIRDLSRLDPQTQERVVSAVERFAASGQGNSKRLKGIDPPEWRLRVGKWRIRFRRREADQALEILRVLLRDQAY